jgi:glycosyltransferase involved in cell wall biosynthesis
VRIGFDMLAVQSPHHGHRGIGRYSQHLVTALLARDDGHDYFLYAHADLPSARIPTSRRARFRWLGSETLPDGLHATQRVDRLARLNPDGLDVLVVLSPFELWSGYSPPAPPGNGLKLAAVVYDMIPFLFPRDEGPPDRSLARHYRVLEGLKRYDALLAISEATRSDTLRLLGMPEERVTAIGTASDASFFVPDPSAVACESSRAILEGLGITRPFVLNVGGFDVRKNLWRLIDAFALMPKPIRRESQLVLTFTVLPSDRDRLLRYARAAGLDDALIVTGEVSDAALRVLYQRCAAFAFPSLYEGFGLPLLEAMHCGAAVVAGNNSSQPEVVGEAGLLANASDASDIAAKLARVLDDEVLARSLRWRAVEQAGRFRWSETARRASAVLEGLPGRRAVSPPRRDAGRPGVARPRIAFLSPFPPRKSGVSDYSALLLQELKQTYAIDLYHDTGYVPEPALADGALACCDARLFARRAAVRDYHAVVYQMGNSRYHRFLYEAMLRHPGVVTLHDFCLAGFHLDYGYHQGREREFIRDELLQWHPDQVDEIARVLDAPPWDRDIIARACAERGWYLNRRILSSAERVVVHSPWCLEQVQAAAREDAGRVEVIPLGCSLRTAPTDEQRAAIRARFGLPRDALVVASFGFVHPEKLGPEVLDAFLAVAQPDPSAVFVFAGEEADGGASRRRARALGLSDRVRFLGRQPAGDYHDLIHAIDLGVNLRRPPTNGETSAALLDLLAAGVATVVTDVATFADYPDAVVRKVRWDDRGPEGLRRALVALAGDRAAREALGDAAREHVIKNHTWIDVVESYVEVIERCRSEKTGTCRSISRAG